MARRYLIGIDIATSGCKSLLIDDQGTVVARAVEEYALSSPMPGWCEQDPEDWWRALKLSVRQVLKGFDHTNDIEAIGMSGQMHGMVALDRDSRVLRPCIIWADQRTEGQCQEIYERAGGIGGLLALTNNRMLPAYTGGKILWVRENEPSVYDRIRIILNPKDYIRFRLTGEYATEVSDASGTGLFDVRKRAWSYELLEMLDIPRGFLPQCYASPEISGRITGVGAEEIGLPVGLPVVGGGGDAVVESTGTGLVASDVFEVTIGTGGIVATCLEQCHDNPGGRLQVFCNTIPGKWHTMGVMQSAGASLKWFRDILGGTEQEVSRWTGEDVYKILDREASMAEPGAEGLLFLPYLLGERCPHADPDARGGFIGLTLRHDRCHLLRSLMEGVVFGLRDITQVIGEMGITPQEIRASGGGASSPLWRQIQADIFHRDVITMGGASDAAAYGAALVAGSGVGIWPTVEDAAQVLEVETRTSPIRENVDGYERLFPIYQGLYHALKCTFGQISNLT
jgi:xylulokinase